MTEKIDLPMPKELSQPDYREHIQAAFTRSKVAPSAASQELIAAGWRRIDWIIGDITSIRVLEADRVEIKMFGSTSEMKNTDSDRRIYFQFRKPGDDFLAEARRSQSQGLGFDFGCLAKAPAGPESPFLVQRITHYEVWGRPSIRIHPPAQPLRVDAGHNPLLVKVVV